jgi:bla regulator protein BlaR1
LPLLHTFVLNHVVPSVFDAAASLLLVFILLYLFQIRNPRTRFALYFVILIRALLVLIDNSYTEISITEKVLPIMFGVRVVDPFGLLLLNDSGVINVAYNGNTLVVAITIAFCAIVGIIILRWIQLLIFLHNLKSEPEINRVEYPWLYEMIDAISANLNIKQPRAVQSDRFSLVPFAVGLNKPTIVLSHELIVRFPRDQLEIMLAHEIAHIKRYDYINNWLMMLLRDVMFFNPIAYFIYRKAEEEKEIICDREILRAVNTTPKKIACLLVDVALFYKAEQLKTSRVPRSLTKGFLYKKSTLDRRIASILNTPIQTPNRHKSSSGKTTLKLIMYLMLLLIQISFMININGSWIILL